MFFWFDFFVFLYGLLGICRQPREVLFFSLFHCALETLNTFDTTRSELLFPLEAVFTFGIFLFANRIIAAPLSKILLNGRSRKENTRKVDRASALQIE